MFVSQFIIIFINTTSRCNLLDQTSEEKFIVIVALLYALQCAAQCYLSFWEILFQTFLIPSTEELRFDSNYPLLLF
jgi:hypothetical protein